MHGFSRLGPGRAANIIVNSSPPSSPRLRNGRSKIKGTEDGFSSGIGGSGLDKEKIAVFRIIVVFILDGFKRRGVLLFAPLLYILGMLYMGSFGFDFDSNPRNGNGVLGHKVQAGSVYRSPQLFEKLWPYMVADNASYNALAATWSPKLAQTWKPCEDRNITKQELQGSNGFFIVEANGGLNQQRLSICDAVAVAGLLNATLVIPIFHLNSVWQDSSKFGDIFDEEFFVNSLKNNVNVVRELPKGILERFDNNISNIVNLRVKALLSPTYYLQKVLPKLMRMRAVRIAPFSNRLASEAPSNVQRLRCMTNFKVLRFSEPIRLLAEKMVDRMMSSSFQGGGKYVSVHLRFEKDMVAFSCCEYGGGIEEKHEMDIARERSWRGKFRKRGKMRKAGANRMDGKCPLTPLEVGMMLRGMGFSNNTIVYIAAGNIYKKEKHMAPLKRMFPHLKTKETLATAQELAPFKGHLSRLAALDYMVCLHSEVFVTTQGGNFPHFLMGHRRYLYGGHAKSIKPDKKALAILFDNPNIRWEDFKRAMQDMLHRSNARGVQLRKPGESIYTFPMPDCMCKQPEVVFENTGN